MSSNYPSGISESTYGAPWNVIEIEKEVEITLKCVVSTTISGPRVLTVDDEHEIISELIESTATTSAQPKLALYAIEQLEVNLPCLEEQTKIADFLSTIDQKMDVVSEQLKQAKTWKKGLLQQMFV